MKRFCIYKDQGVASFFLPHFNEFCKKISLDFSIFFGDADFLINKNDWEENIDFLIMPGGRDVFYQKKLYPKGTERIKHFVESGGTYIGICAGAYFATRKINFLENSPILKVQEKRNLVFFPGESIGPAYSTPEFTYFGFSSSRIAQLVIHEENSYAQAFFNGGCYFKDAVNFSNTKVLATYKDLPNNLPAAVSCKVNKGRALLFGFHIEYEPKLCKKFQKQLSHIKKELMLKENRETLTSFVKNLIQ